MPMANGSGRRVIGAQGSLGRKALAARKPGSRAEAGDGFAFALEGDGPFGRAVEQRHVFRQIGNLLPGLGRVEAARKDEDANRFLMKLLESVDEGEAGWQAVVGFDERVARQQHEINAAFEGHADEPFEGGPGRVLHNRRHSRGQGERLSNRIVEADVGRVQKAQWFKWHGRSLPSPGQRGRKCSRQASLGEERFARQHLQTDSFEEKSFGSGSKTKSKRNT